MGVPASPKPSALDRSATRVRIPAGRRRLAAATGVPARSANTIAAIKTAVAPTSPMPIAIFHPYLVVALCFVIIPGSSFLLFGGAVATASMAVLHHFAVDAG